MKYISTRGDTHDRAASPTSCSKAWRPTAGCTCRRRTRSVDAATLARWRGLPYAELAFEILSLYIDDIPAADLQAPVPRHLHRAGLRHAADHAAEAARATACTCRPCPTARRWPSRTWRCSCWATCSNTNWRAAARSSTSWAPPRGDTGSAAEYAMRGKQRRARLHAQPARPHEPVPAGADVQPAGRQHPQHRRRGRVRRLPGHRQGGQQRPRLQAPVPHRHRQLDQLGAAAGAGRLLLRRLLPGHADRTTNA